MTEIVVEQRIEAPPSKVYGYLTDSEKWSRWQGESAHLDARVGGLFSLRMPNGMNARGEFTELIPNSRVSFTWGWVDRPGIPPGSTEVSIELRPDGDGTLLVLTHRSLPLEEAEHHRSGWARDLPTLAKVASGRPASGEGGI